MTEPYRLPTANVVKSELSGEVATVTVKISTKEYLSYPIAPADLRREDPHELVFPFHQLIKRQGKRLTFETYRPQLPLPAPGTIWAFCSWWLPRAMDAVRDTSARWELLSYPDEEDHDHCLLTWDTISAYGGEMEAYRSSHGWITVAAYREYIEQDVLRVRSNWRSVE